MPVRDLMCSGREGIAIAPCVCLCTLFERDKRCPPVYGSRCTKVDAPGVYGPGCSGCAHTRSCAKGDTVEHRMCIGMNGDRYGAGMGSGGDPVGSGIGKTGSFWMVSGLYPSILTRITQRTCHLSFPEGRRKGEPCSRVWEYGSPLCGSLVDAAYRELD